MPLLEYILRRRCLRIGSVAANFARTKEQEDHAEYTRFSHHCPEGENLLQTFGKPVYDRWLAGEEVRCERARVEDEKKRVRKEARKVTGRECCRRVKEGVKRVLRYFDCFN
ncbi:MAG: hypothetical protein L6R41_005865 [Letrouitia leprolyta]|nr:MAG: hypothetical protein L6R41_005865 [Letrouitia leprolyta]